MNDPADFLGALYETVPEGTGVVELRAFGNDGGMVGRLFTESPEEIRYFARKAHPNSQVGAFFGVALRKPGSTTGKKQDVSVIPALWADIDVVKMGWDMDRTLGMLKMHELRPSAVVNSGNGLHAYWCLDQPVLLDDDHPHDLQVRELETTMGRLAHVFGGDNTHDITRVLRLPGSWNTKGGKPKLVKVAFAEWQVYRLHELQDMTDKTDRLLDKDGFMTREDMKERTRQAREEAAKLGLAGDFTHAAGFQARKLSWNQIWSLAKAGGAPRGTAFIGLDEAILRATALLYAEQAHIWSDEQIIKNVLAKLHETKLRQAPNDPWDPARETAKIKDKLDRFKPKWSAIQTERSEQRGKKGKQRGGAKDGNHERQAPK